MEPQGESTGPFLVVAALCDQVIEGKDGVLSLIRIVDRYHVETNNPGFTIADAPEYRCTMVVALKSGTTQGSHSIAIQLMRPNGLIDSQKVEVSPHFEPGNNGVNLIFPLTFRPQHEGMHWFDVRFEGRLLTRIPLQVVVQRQLVTRT